MNFQNRSSEVFVLRFYNTPTLQYTNTPIKNDINNPPFRGNPKPGPQGPDLYFCKDIECSTTFCQGFIVRQGHFADRSISMGIGCKEGGMVILFLRWAGGMINCLNSCGNLCLGDSKCEKKDLLFNM